ncbi:MAG: YncE family protein [Methylococcales bacterium]
MKKKSIQFVSGIVGMLFAVAASAVEPPNVVTTIPVGVSPSRAVITPNNQEVYVTNNGDDTVSVIRSGDLTVKTVVPVGSQPDAIAVSPDGKSVYVGQHGGDISRITTSNKSVTTIPIGAPVRDLALSPDGTKLLVAMEFGGLKVVDTSTLAVSTVNSTACPEAVVFTPDGAKAYVNYQCAPSPGSGGHDPIYVFDGMNLSFKSAIAFLPDGTRMANVGSPTSVSPDGQQVWANGGDSCINYDLVGCPAAPAGVINVIRTYDNSVIKTLAFPNLGVGHITLSPLNTYAMVAHGSDLLFINTKSFVTSASLPIAASGYVAVTHCGTRGFAPIPGQNEVAVLRLPLKL